MQYFMMVIWFWEEGLLKGSKENISACPIKMRMMVYSFILNSPPQLVISNECEKSFLLSFFRKALSERRHYAEVDLKDFSSRIR